MRLIASGGGTAGHISPTLAALAALKSLDSDLEVLYIGQAGSMEAKIVAAFGLEFAAISAGKFRRMHGASLARQLVDLSTLGLNARDSLRVLSGVAQSLRIIRSFGPDAIFIKGGYVGLPVGLAAGLLRVPYIIHESDLVPGLANRLLAKRATKIAVGFPTEKYPDWPAEKLVYTGNPVRREILEADPVAARRHFHLEADLPVVLVTGGSQGAEPINRTVVEALPRLLEKVQVIHVTGERGIEATRFRVGRLKLKHPERYQAQAFLSDDMGLALAAADVVVGRAGATTIAELATLSKPAILVPNSSMAGHQVANAQLLARSGAVRVIGEDRLSPTLLAREIEQVLDSTEERHNLIKNIEDFAVAGADVRLALAIQAVARPHE